MTTPAYIVLDLETTGLDPDHDQILEIGAIAVDAEWNRLPINHFHQIAAYVLTERQRFGPDGLAMEASRPGDPLPVVREMHTANRLWLDCRESNISEIACGLWLREWLWELGFRPGRNGPKVILAGSAIGTFDHRFLLARLPMLEGLLSHRTVDISAIARAMRAAGYDVPETPKDKIPHRSIPDCEMELAEMQLCHRLLTEGAALVKADRETREAIRAEFAKPVVIPGLHPLSSSADLDSF